MQYNVTVENNQQLRERVGLLDKRLVFKDNTAKAFLTFDTKIGGKRYYKKTRYTENTKKEAVAFGKRDY